MDRRNFLQRVGAGTSLFLPISSLFLAKDEKGASEPNQAPPLSAGDVALATIALNAGYLESEFFLRALNRQGPINGRHFGAWSSRACLSVERRSFRVS